MTVQLTGSGGSLNPAKVEELEMTLKTKLPEDFKTFLNQYNVAIPAENIYRAGGITTSVDQFFGISPDENEDIVSQNLETYSGRLPSRAVAIALAGGGNLICLRTSDGSVYFWDHEREALPDEQPSYNNMTRLAQTFTEFLEHLEPYLAEDFKVSTGKVKSVKLKPGFAEKFKKYM